MQSQIIDRRERFALNLYGEKITTMSERDTDVKNTVVIKKITQMDPTRNKKYVPWIAKQYANQLFRLEDASRITDVLNGFIECNGRITNRDINKFTLHQLEKMVDTILTGGVSEEYVPGQYSGLEGVKYLYDGPLGVFAIPLTVEASMALGRGTKWCTAGKNNNVFNQYHSDGPLHIWIDAKGEKYQFWLSDSGGLQMMDSSDRELEAEQIRFFRNHQVTSSFFIELERRWPNE